MNHKRNSVEDFFCKIYGDGHLECASKHFDLSEPRQNVFRKPKRSETCCFNRIIADVYCDDRNEATALCCDWINSGLISCCAQWLEI